MARLLIMLALCMTCVTAEDMAAETCDVSKLSTSVYPVNANAVIGGLFGMRIQGSDGYGCGLPARDTMQIYEAARWAIGKINIANRIPGITLGIKAYDTCYSTVQGTNAAYEFYPRSTSPKESCTSVNPQQITLGFLGPVSSWTSKMVAALIKSFTASAVSPRAASSELSNKALYPTFLRTSPSTALFARVIDKLLGRLQWQKIVLVYSETDYGKDFFKDISQLTFSQKKCIIQVLPLKESGTLDYYRQQLSTLSKTSAKGGIVWGSFRSLDTVIDAMDSVMSSDQKFAEIQWIFSDLSLEQSYDQKKVVKGAIIVQPSTTLIQEFRSYFVNLEYNAAGQTTENPWYKEWYMLVNKCKFTGVTNPPYVNYQSSCDFIPKGNVNKFTQQPYVDTTIKAVYVYAEALRQASQFNCGGTGQLCYGLRNMDPMEFHNSYLKKARYTFQTSDGIASLVGQTVQFDSNGDPPESQFGVWQYKNNRFQQVGNFSNNILNLNTSDLTFYNRNRDNVISSLPVSLCTSNICNECVLPYNPVEILQVPGDILIGSLTQLHNQGHEPFSCGDYSTTNLQSLIAIKYALSKYSDVLPANTLKNVKLGGVFVDACSNREVLSSFLVNLLSGARVYKDSQNRYVDPQKLKMFVQSSLTYTLEQTSLVTSSFRIPEIDSMATASKLSDRSLYPYFNRAVPSDAVQAKAIVTFMKRMGWTYFQLVVRDDVFGEQALKDMEREARKAQICMAASYKFGMSGRELVNKLRENYLASTIVVFGFKADIRTLFQGMKDQGAIGEYQLIGAEPWGTRLSVIQDYNSQAEGSIIFQMDSQQNLGFKQYLTQTYNTLEKIRQDPIFSKWYESEFKCYLNAGNKQFYQKACDSGLLVSQLWIQPNTAALISSVYASAKAIHNTLVDICGSGYSVVCNKARVSSEFNEKLLSNIRNIQLNYVEENTPYSFEVVNGEGTQNFNIFSVKSGQYVKVTSYNTKTGFLNSNFDPKSVAKPPSYGLPSQCSGKCYQCYVYQAEPHMYIPGDFIIGGIFAVSTPGGSGPFACGSGVTADGFQLTAAMQYALSMVNSGKAPVGVKGVTLGGFMEDHCNNPRRTYGLLNSFYSGLVEKSMSTWGTDTSKLRPRRVPAWLTDSTISAAEAGSFLQQFNIPVVSPFSTARSLKSNPVFYRTVLGEDTLAMAMVKLAKSLNLVYVHAVRGLSEEDKSGVKYLEAAAQQEGICIIGMHVMTDNNTAADVVKAVSDSASHVVVLYLGESDMKKFLAAKQSAKASNIVLISPTSFDTVVSGAGTTATNMLALKLKSPATATAGFLSYINKMKPEDNRYFSKYYSEVFKCNLPGYFKYASSCGTSLRDFSVKQVSSFVLPTINAVYAVADALDRTLKQFCGESYKELCLEFQQAQNVQAVLAQNLNRVTFVNTNTFQFLDRDANVEYDLVRYNGSQYETIGSYAGATIQIITEKVGNHYSSISSSCSSNCLRCVQQGLNFTYIPGDILIGGLFDVHEKSYNPFTCGAIKPLHGFQLLEAFHYALGQVNSKEGKFKDILRGTRLGGVGLDTCESAIRTGYLVSDVHNKLTKLVRNTDTINPDDIDVYVGSYASDQSIYLARILKDLKIPQISYASTSTQLKDQYRYPYFYRTVPADDHQARAMVSFLNRFDFRYVQVVYTLTNYGESAARAFQKLAAEFRICIAQMILFPDNGTVSTESSNNVITALMKKPLANTVVVFAGTSYINAFLKAVQRNTNAKGKFRFLGSETWANNEDAFRGVEEVALGSVTLNVETKNIGAFDTYLETKSPANAQENPWFNEYYEYIHNCYLTKSRGLYPEKCQSEPKKLPKSIRYKQDTGILHVINAVYASAFAIDKAIREVCGDNYVAVCETYKKMSDRRNLVLKHLQNVSFTDPTHTLFAFSNKKFSDEDGFSEVREGNKGYQFYSIVMRPIENKPGYDYKEIGTFSSSGKLEISDYARNWDSTCNRDDTCTECPVIRNSQGSRYSVLTPKSMSNIKPWTIIGVFDIHEQGMDPYRCGELKTEEGFQQFLAFWYTFSLPQFENINAVAVDTCSNSLRVDQDLWNLLAGQGLCTEAFSEANKVSLSNIGGVVVMNDKNTFAAARVLNDLKVAYISPSAQSVQFNNTAAFPYLARTSPPRDQLLRVLADILKEAGWDYVVGIESYWHFDSSGRQEFVRTSSGKTCLRFTYSLPNNPANEDFKTAVASLRAAQGSNVVILFTNKEDTIKVLKAAKELNLLDSYLWVFTDVSYEDIRLFTFLTNTHFRGLVFSLRDASVAAFKNYIVDISNKPDTSPDKYNIPKHWFDEYYQKLHKCQMTDAQFPLKQFTKKCLKNETINFNNVSQNRYILPTIAAVHALGNELEAYKSQKCSQQSVEACLQSDNARESIFNYVLKSNWPRMKIDLTLQTEEPYEDFVFSFNKYRFWDIGYNVLMMEVNKTSLVSVWKQGKLTVKDEKSLKRFTSTCPAGLICGCTQPDASQQQLTPPTTTPPEPRNFFHYSDQGEQLYEWPVWAIAVAVLTSIGIIVTIMTLIFLLIYYPIRGGTTVLGFFTIIGILGIYGVNFAFFVHASEITCAARRLVMGIVYMMVFACLLVKAVDNWRYSDSEWEGKRYHGITSACALFLCALGIVCIQAVIPIEWLILIPPTAVKAAGVRHDLWFCHAIDNSYDTGLVMSFIFVMVIVGVTGIVAMMSWDSENNYSESRWILVSCVCTAGCFLVWMIVSTNAGFTYRDPTVAIANFVNATLLLICIPLRKAALLLLMRTEEKKEKLAAGADVSYQNGFSDVYTNEAYDPHFYEYQRQESKQDSDVGF